MERLWTPDTSSVFNVTLISDVSDPSNVCRVRAPSKSIVFVLELKELNEKDVESYSKYWHDVQASIAHVIISNVDGWIPCAALKRYFIPISNF